MGHVVVGRCNSCMLDWMLDHPGWTDLPYRIWRCVPAGHTCSMCLSFLFLFLCCMLMAFLCPVTFWCSFERIYLPDGAVRLFFISFDAASFSLCCCLDFFGLRYPFLPFDLPFPFQVAAPMSIGAGPLSSLLDGLLSCWVLVNDAAAP